DAPDDEPPGPRAGASEAGILTDWREAEAGLAAALARVAGRLRGMAGITEPPGTGAGRPPAQTAPHTNLTHIL
ncbi:hypothetical protein IU397_22705, partial [Actibacterium sp. 188UL27-1]|nr:hypothetical protein [Actibacterium sp. 188UL27-1]